ncbi:MAG: hypothetical protein JWM87_1903 [Candidatus Eremiobacteraeota bacterium]|nr:hypothetical protein [Candidatus Eremiobacteraeota bacterium]
MRQTIISFAAVYAVVLCTSSCNGGSTSVPAFNSGTATTQYTQIERLARPAVKELFQQFANHDGTNKTAPWQTPLASQTLYQEIGSFTTSVAGRNAAHAATLQAILIPDEIAADLSQPGSAAYLGVETGGATGGKFGGRGLPDDVIDISLGAVFGNTLTALGLVPDDGKQSPCLTTDNVPNKNAQDNVTPAVFPYVGAPH